MHPACPLALSANFHFHRGPGPAEEIPDPADFLPSFCRSQARQAFLRTGSGRSETKLNHRTSMLCSAAQASRLGLFRRLLERSPHGGVMHTYVTLRYVYSRDLRRPVPVATTSLTDDLMFRGECIRVRRRRCLEIVPWSALHTVHISL
jgi:hypothetical protein